MRELKINRVYKHFKGNYYFVVGLASCSSTKEKYVVYKALYEEGDLWIRPVDEFLSEVDHEKYPDAPQKYRFEEIVD